MAMMKKTPAKKMQMGRMAKAKNGKSFPDLNKDGKITKADILKGRGVIAKKGASVRKAGFGDILGKVAKVGGFGLAGMAANKLFGGKKKEAAAPGMAPATAPAAAAPMAAPVAPVVAPPMKKGGKVVAKKKVMKSGGSVKKAGMHKMPDGSMMKNSKMKSGGKMGKCKYGCN